MFESGIPLSFSADIWALAFAIWPISGQRSLFNGKFAIQNDNATEAGGLARHRSARQSLRICTRDVGKKVD
jgi:hypothetical protein